MKKFCKSGSMWISCTCHPGLFQVWCSVPHSQCCAQARLALNFHSLNKSVLRGPRDSEPRTFELSRSSSSSTYFGKIDFDLSHGYYYLSIRKPDRKFFGFLSSANMCGILWSLAGVRLRTISKTLCPME